MSIPANADNLRAPQGYLPPLESLRGWAIMLVVLFHYVGILTLGREHAGQEGTFLLQILAAGNTGVTLFFVLSGFLLVRPFLQVGQRGFDILRFYSSRLLRIVPLYYTCVLTAWLLSDNPAALKGLLFVPIGFEVFPYSVPWWSLSTEMQFYLMLPWIMLGLGHRTGRWIIKAALLCWMVLHVRYLHDPQWLANPHNSTLQSSIFGRGTAFLIGGLCSWLYMRTKNQWLNASAMRTTLVTVILLGALLFLLHWYGATGQKPSLLVLPMYHSIEAILWGGLLLCSLSAEGRLSRLFINPLWSHFGNISYSLYLVHLPLQFYLIYPAMTAQANASTLLLAVVASFALSWTLSVTCYRLIEQPFLRLRTLLLLKSDEFTGPPSKA